ncbi:hypothetical protein FSP39_012440 [Pinctada imbricata]|uniref:RNA helicase n=1 Tax=Pinctada imbricata TaxID=66713 RepID=A0AA88Y454_PINIB|nr:hypothetical protein FSP39_012440 [Pinctada imbricata]
MGLFLVSPAKRHFVRPSIRQSVHLSVCDQLPDSRKRQHTSDDESDDDEAEDRLLMDDEGKPQQSDDIDVGFGKLLLSDEENEDKEDESQGIRSDVENERNERGLELRNYQLELAALAVTGKNTIIHAATGAGKTRVAFYIIKRHLDNNPSGKVAVLADKNFLVRQHYLALKAFLPDLEEKSVYISGDKGNSASLQHFLEDKSIFILTPALIENTIKSLDDPSFICKFTLMFFDECHHTHKKTTYKRLMNEYLKLKEQGRKLPQIVGLTATLGTNRANSLEKAKDHVLTIMSNLDCAKLSTVKENIEEYDRYRSDYSETKETLPEPDEKDPFYQCIDAAMTKTERFMRTVLNDLDVSDPDEKTLKDSLQSPPSVRRYKAEYETWISVVSSSATSLLEKRRNVAHIAKIGTTYLKIYREVLYIKCYLNNEYAMSVLEKRLKKDRLGQYSVSNESTEAEFAEFARDLITSMKSEAKNIKTPGRRSPIDFLLDQLEKQNEELRFILFVKTREFAEMLNDFLTRKGYKCSAFTGASAASDEGGRSRTKTGIRIVLANCKDSQRDVVNIQRGRLMDEAVKDVLAMEDAILMSIIERKQRQICESERRSQGTVSKVHKLDNCRFKMTCKSCGKFDVDCSKIRSIDGAHHILVEKDIWKYMTAQPFPKNPPRFHEDIILQGKLFGNGKNGCTHQWGTVFSYKGVRLPAISHKLLAVKDTDTKRTWKIGKWEEAPFSILPISEDDLNLMATAEEK